MIESSLLSLIDICALLTNVTGCNKTVDIEELSNGALRLRRSCDTCLLIDTDPAGTISSVPAKR